MWGFCGTPESTRQRARRYAQRCGHSSWSVRKGALGERRVAAALDELSDEYRVLHGADLYSRRPLTDHTGSRIYSAQIDHLVVGPAGVFVIETKSWSRTFSESSGAHCPHHQVARASLLCWQLIKIAGLNERVRSVIACDDHTIPHQEGSYARVLRPASIRRHIYGFGRQLSPARIRRISEFLGAFQAA